MSINNQLTNFWNTLTGQTQEDARTKATNEANLAQVESTNQANRDIAHETNEANLAIARENLGYQRELQEYNKALQQQIFEREDTSYQRTAKDMLAAGLNPLSMQGTNGAGEAVAMSPLNNGATMQTGAPMQAAQFQKANVMDSPLGVAGKLISGVGSITSMINQLKTGQLERDSIRLQNDSQYIDNLIKAQSKGIYYGKSYHDKPDFELTKDYANYIKSEQYKHESSIRDYEHDVKIGRYSSDTELSRMLTDIEDWALNGRGEEVLNKLKQKYPLLEFFTSLSEPEEKQKASADKNPAYKKYLKYMHPDLYKKLYPDG